MWAPPVGPRLAYGLGPAPQDGLHPFRIADLALPNLELGGYRALFGVIIWSPDDAQRIAWCGRQSHRLRPGDRRAGDAPAALPGRLHAGRRGRLRGRESRSSSATARSSRRTAASRTRSSGPTARSRSSSTEADRALGRKLPHDDEDPTRLPGHHSNSSCNDNCAALLPIRQAVQLIDLGCKPATDQPSRSRANTAAWSPGRDLGRDLERRRDRVPPCCRRRDWRSPGRSAPRDGLAAEPLGGSGNPRRDARGYLRERCDARPLVRRPARRARRLGLRRRRRATSTSMAPPLQSRSRAAAAASPAASSTRRSRHQTSPSPTSRARR